MALYDRLLGLQQPKISVHAFFGVMQEFSLGNMTAAQATAAFGLDAGEQAEATAIRDRILQETNANATLQSVMRRLRALEFEQVLILGESGVAPFATVAAVKARLGV